MIWVLVISLAQPSGTTINILADKHAYLREDLCNMALLDKVARTGLSIYECKPLGVLE